MFSKIVKNVPLKHYLHFSGKSQNHPTLQYLIAVHVRLFFFQNFGRMYGLIRHCMSIYTRITEFITYKKPKIITVCITILSYLYVKYALLQACMFKNSLKQLCLYVYMDCTAIKHSRVIKNKDEYHKIGLISNALDTLHTYLLDSANSRPCYTIYKIHTYYIIILHSYLGISQLVPIGF